MTFTTCIRNKGHEGEHSWKAGDEIDFDRDSITLCLQAVEVKGVRALLSDDIVQQIHANTIKPLSIGFGPNHYRTPKPLTRRQKFGRWRRNLRWSIHDRLFPECSEYDR